MEGVSHFGPPEPGLAGKSRRARVSVSAGEAGGTHVAPVPLIALKTQRRNWIENLQTLREKDRM